MNKKLIYLAACVAVIVFVSGCANGPIRNFFRGGYCNTCQPPVGQPMGCGTNTAPLCDSGACGTGVIGPAQTSFFRRPFFRGDNFAPPATSEIYYGDSIEQPFLTAPGIEVDPYGSIPESADVYGSSYGAPSAPSIGPLQGSSSR